MKNKKELILETAQTLFSKEGYQRVGVDRIRDEANVSKMTMYKYFPSKDILVENVLLKRDLFFKEQLTLVVEKQTGCLNQLRAIFDWHRHWFEQPDFHGCLFIKATQEYHEVDSAIRAISKTHKHFIQQIIEHILVNGNIKEAASLAQYLLIVLEGSIINANMFSDAYCIDTSWHYAEKLITAMI